MATYTELAALPDDPAFGALRSKILVAISIAAADLIDGSPNNTELNWANAVLNDPSSVLDGVIRYLLASNAGMTKTQILEANETAVQTQVNAAAAKLATITPVTSAP